MEDRRLLTVESFDLIGVEAYFDSATFSQYDGSGPSSTKYRIAILDTGAELDHEDFGTPQNGVGERIVYQYDFLDDDADASDPHGHGTHVASIAARMAPGAELIILRVVDAFENPDPAAIADALQWVFDNRNDYNIVAVNMSFGMGNYQTEQTGNDNEWSDDMSEILADLDEANVICIAASGNDFALFESAEGIGYPAADPSVMSVGAVWDDDVGAQGNIFTTWHDNATAADWVAAFTQRDEDLLDILAPGGVITAAWESIGTNDDSGTSQAAPHVTAAVALAQHIKQDVQGGGRLSRNDLLTLFQSTGKPIEDTERATSDVDETGHTWDRIDVQAMAFKLFKPAAADLKNTSDWGFSETDNKTYDVTPTITGSAPAGSHVWIYDGSSSIDDFQLGAGVSTFERTLPTLGAGTHNITVRVALTGSVVEANRSEPSNVLALNISATDSITLDDAEEPFSARLSEFMGGQALIVAGENVSGTSTLTINWGTSPLRALTKTGSGSVMVDDVTDHSVTLTYNANAGTTIFTTDTGVSGIPGTSTRVANWTVETAANVEFTTSQNLAALSMGAAGFVTVTTATPPNYNVLYVDELSFTEVGGVPAGTLDLKNNGMVIEFGTTTAAQNYEANLLRDWLIEGRGGTGVGNGTWDGNGITSSTAEAWNATAAEQRSIGYAVNDVLSDLVHGDYTSFLGHTVDSLCIIMRYTVTCDTDLTGTVDGDDVTVFGAVYDPNDGHWTHGDADYNWFVDDDDGTLFGVMNGLSLES